MEKFFTLEAQRNYRRTSHRSRFHENMERICAKCSDDYAWSKYDLRCFG